MVNRLSANPKTRPGRADGPRDSARRPYRPPRITSSGKAHLLVAGSGGNPAENSPHTLKKP